jgi:hypothetical protein
MQSRIPLPTVVASVAIASHVAAPRVPPLESMTEKFPPKSSSGS